ncbi:Putative YTH domain containing protein [Septoria linicola]|uniref:YTH domain containing protein n=1 Tax=Septoria linicola TaxID=215465 RepID=A0A9Q9AYI0_9PEZI|nr:Putative YTH domain containing protein [Septoria linicola]
MGDFSHTASRQDEDRQPAYHSPGQQAQHPSSAPFQSQFEYLSQNQQQAPQNMSQYGQQPFDMGSLAGALPQNVPSNMSQRAYGSPDLSQGLSSSNPYQQQQQAMFTQQRGPSFDPAMLARAQQQQFLGTQYGGPSPLQRQQQFNMQGQMAYSPIDPYGFGISPSQYSPIDPRFAQQAPYLMGGMPNDMSKAGRDTVELLEMLILDSAQYARRASIDTAPVPNFPRGPPRKPKQSGHALWVGNLPPAAVVTDLKDHFSRDATNDIESVFLIAKSNCAFVNYRTEAACIGAMNRFHDSRFHGVRLVCRLRRGTTATSPAAIEEQSDTLAPPAKSNPPSSTTDETSDSPTIARSQSGQSSISPEIADGISEPPQSDEKVPEKYYIVKSLTAQDLEASVRNGIWATQSHNEKILNRAFERADNVYLVFSANKSGEYFGYARMASSISGEPVNLSALPSSEEPVAGSESAGSPQSIPTPATATAPQGRIIDDSARGTIFWEADHADGEGESPAQSGEASDHWGKQFKIEWLSTSRLPFYRTRGLRNPWNANREVKIARDGTELEPSVGKRLIQMFHRPQQPPQPGMVVPGAVNGMPYHR